LELVCRAAGTGGGGGAYPHPLFRVCRRLACASADAVTRVCVWECRHVAVNSPDDAVNGAVGSAPAAAAAFVRCLRSAPRLGFLQVSGNACDECDVGPRCSRRGGADGAGTAAASAFRAALRGCVDALTLTNLGVLNSALVGSVPVGAGGGVLRELDLACDAGPVGPALALIPANAATLRVLDVTMDADDASHGVGVEAALRRSRRLPCVWWFALDGEWTVRFAGTLAAACPALTKLEVSGMVRPGALAVLALPALPRLVDVRVDCFWGQDPLTQRELAAEVGAFLRGRALDLLKIVPSEHVEEPTLLLDAALQVATMPAALKFYSDEEGDEEECQCGVGDADLARLTAAPGATTLLRSLTIELGHSVSAAGLRCLAGLPALQRLHLLVEAVDEAAVRPWVITHVPHLKLTVMDPTTLGVLVAALAAPPPEGGPTVTALRRLGVSTNDPLPAAWAGPLGALPLTTFRVSFAGYQCRADVTERRPPSVRAAADAMAAWSSRLWGGHVATIDDTGVLPLDD